MQSSERKRGFLVAFDMILLYLRILLKTFEGLDVAAAKSALERLRLTQNSEVGRAWLIAQK